MRVCGIIIISLPVENSRNKRYLPQGSQTIAV